jgi:23S rRNA (guanosine2251-2'-O)-methyltransferase
MNEQMIYGRIAVLEALKAGRPIDKLYILKPPYTGSIQQIAAKARAMKIPMQEVERERLDQLCDKANHQGVAAVTAAYPYVEWQDIVQRAKDKGEAPFLILCESIQDPHNLGAILRTADAAGVHGVIISQRHAVGLTDAVAKTAAGALEYVPVARVNNMARLIDDLKKEGIWTAAADMDGQLIYQTDLRGPIAVVIGGEHEGVSRLVRERCDYIVRLPMKGEVTSLNASVAAGIMMFEIGRQREY